MIKVALFEDNLSFSNALELLFLECQDMELVRVERNLSSIEKVMEEYSPDVVLMDIDLPGINGIEAVAIVKSVSPKTQVIMLTVFDNEEKIFQAIRNGASGYLLKSTSPAEIIEAIFDVNKGGSPMTANVARKVLQFFQQQRAVGR